MTIPERFQPGLSLCALSLGLAVPAMVLTPDETNCEKLAKLTLPYSTTITAELVAGGTLTPNSGGPITGLPSFCRVALTAHPPPDSDIRIEVWMPESNWNGRMEGTGNGGLAGGINYRSLGSGVRLDYVVANTDMGMATPPGKSAAVFVDRPDRWADWGYRATHEMTLLARQLVKAYYGSDPKRSYFVGCSTGGEQALMEAQRFPDDYDGIVGGAPAQNRTGVHESILWTFGATQKYPASYLPPAKIALLSKAVVRSCDAVDGVKDGLIADPRKCGFDPATLRCESKDSDSCLTEAQVASVKAIYKGPVDPRTGHQIYPGLSMGSEFGWTAPTPSPKSSAPFAPVFQWVFGSGWDWRTFDFAKDVDTMNARLAGTLNATSPNLDAFREHGHKLLLYHGWSDPLVAPQETVNYYDAVVAREAGMKVRQQHLDDAAELIRNSVRLFMIPGMSHCGGGPGPSDFDPLNMVVKWVESGIAPDRVIVTRPKSAKGDEPTPHERRSVSLPASGPIPGLR
jgi:feruloyl esterase